jgi:hypothetical protein
MSIGRVSAYVKSPALGDDIIPGEVEALTWIKGRQQLLTL